VLKDALCIRDRHSLDMILAASHIEDVEICTLALRIRGRYHFKPLDTASSRKRSRANPRKGLGVLANKKKLSKDSKTRHEEVATDIYRLMTSDGTSIDELD